MPIKKNRTLDNPVSEYLINLSSSSFFNLVECLLTLACEQDLWSRDFWKSKRACEAIELGHCWGGIKLVPSTALSVSVYYMIFMWLLWMCSSAPTPNPKKIKIFSMCVCKCVILLQATSCITTELAYVYELVSLYYILTILLQSDTIGTDACVCFFFSESCQPFDWFPPPLLLLLVLSLHITMSFVGNWCSWCQ